MGNPSSSIVWFRRDLRIDDNPALAAAAKDGPVLPVFIWCPEEEGQFFPGRVSRWWLKESLVLLHQSLKSLGSPLLFIKAESTLTALLQCIAATGATKVVFNHLYDPISLVRDHDIKRQLTDIGVGVHTFNGDLLHEPWEVYDDTGHAFTIFDAFWDKCICLPIQQAYHFPPWQLIQPEGSKEVESCSIDILGLEYEIEKSSNALLSRAWSPGWSNAEKVLNEFVGCHLLDYAKNRMKLEGITTSLLSPYLHYGEISVKKIYQSVRIKQLQWAKEGISHAEDSVHLFLRSIGLREYSRYLCFNFPFTHERSLLGNLRYYPWRVDEAEFKIWRQGRTGYPLVDAGMRELWATGWIHNRTRVIVASFFVKYLLLPWRWGMKYFWDTLLDADLESDILGWQYISGSLPDGHELERLDNPSDQGFRYDPEGEYVRHWLPELVRLPTEWIHHPWDAPESVLRAAGVELGLNYPKPVVEMAMAKERLHEAVARTLALDRTARANNLSGSNEAVADNMMSIHKLDIPKVVLKKELSCLVSVNDQRVPSMELLKDSKCKAKKVENLDCEGTNQKKVQDYTPKSEILRIDDELRSTAESSSARKRSISHCQYAVPMPSLSLSDGQQSNFYGMQGTNYSTGSPSRRPWSEARAFQKKEAEADAQSTNEDLRPCKRPL